MINRLAEHFREAIDGSQHALLANSVEVCADKTGTQICTVTQREECGHVLLEIKARDIKEFPGKPERFSGLLCGILRRAVFLFLRPVFTGSACVVPHFQP